MYHSSHMLQIGRRLILFRNQRLSLLNVCLVSIGGLGKVLSKSVWRQVPIDGPRANKQLADFLLCLSHHIPFFLNQSACRIDSAFTVVDGLFRFPYILYQRFYLLALRIQSLTQAFNRLFSYLTCLNLLSQLLFECVGRGFQHVE